MRRLRPDVNYNIRSVESGQQLTPGDDPLPRADIAVRLRHRLKGPHNPLAARGISPSVTSCEERSAAGPGGVSSNVSACQSYRKTVRRLLAPFEGLSAFVPFIAAANRRSELVRPRVAEPDTRSYEPLD